jgi:hypothetical protein
MRDINPIPSGPYVQEERDDHRPDSVPDLPETWTASVLLSPFGDANSSLSNYSQLVVGSIEYCWAPTKHWIRTRLYLTQDLTYFDFVFISQFHRAETCEWYWIDSTPTGDVDNIYGPLPTGLQIPSPAFFSDMTQAGNADALRWGNRYPLMCTDTNPEGIDCDHWIGGRSWYSFRRDTGKLFRILTMDSSNPQAVPILGAYYLANIPTFRPGVLSRSSHELIERIRKGDVQGMAGGVNPDPNPMVTQQDLHRAMASPLASKSCTVEDIQKVLPGFAPMPAEVPLPVWTDRVYIEGWTLWNDAVPYRTRVCYLWTGDTDSKHQTVFIGQAIDVAADPARPSWNAYLGRADACLSTSGTGIATYKWTCEQWTWSSNIPGPNVGLPHPDWLSLNKAVVMGKIVGNSAFGLADDETLYLIAATADKGNGVLAIFWVWFLENGVGMMFSEATFLDSSGHLEVIDYNRFERDAAVTQADFSGPFPVAAAADRTRVQPVVGHPMSLLPKKTE